MKTLQQGETKMKNIRKMARTTLAATLVAAGLAGSGAWASDTYKIVSLLDYSGPFANRGKPVEQMQRLLVDWYNETRGAERGVSIELDPVDTGYDQAKTVQAYERALQDDKLIGFVTFGSPNVIALQNRLPENKFPAVHGGPSYSLMEKGSWVFTPLNDYARYFAAAVDWRLASWEGSEDMKVAFATFDGSSGRDWAEGLKTRMGDRNVDIVLEEFISPRALEVTVNVERIIEADPDFVIVAGTDQLQPMILSELHANDFDMTKVLNSQHEGLGLLDLLGVPGEVLEGAYEVTTENYADQTTEAYKIYDERKDNYDTRWAADTLLHYPSIMVMLDAIDRAIEKNGGDRISGQQVYDELANGTFDGRGLLGDIKFSNETDPTLGAAAVVILQQKDGQITQASDFIPLEN